MLLYKLSRKNIYTNMYVIIFVNKICKCYYTGCLEKYLY